GLRELLASLALLAPELRTELRRGLKEAAELVARTGEEIAARQGFSPPGRSGRGRGKLIGTIRAGATTTTGYVRDAAERDGYSYPRRFEFQDSGERAFLHPVLEQDSEVVIQILERSVSEVSRRFNEREI